MELIETIDDKIKNKADVDISFKNKILKQRKEQREQNKIEIFEKSIFNITSEYLRDKIAILEFACEKGNTQIIKMLIKKHNMNINEKFDNDWYPIHVATYYNNINTVEFLINNNANIDVLTPEKLNILHIACKFNFIEIVKLLAKTKIKVNKNTTNNISALSTIINKNTTNNISALYNACFCGYFEIIKILVENDADINAIEKSKHISIFHIACINGNLDIIKYLISKNININVVNIYNENVLFYAFYYNNIELIEFFIDYNQNINNKNNKIDFNNINSDNKTLVHLSVEINNLKLTELLLNNGVIVKDKIFKISYTNIKTEIPTFKEFNISDIDNTNKYKTNLDSFKEIDLSIQKNKMNIINLLIEYKAIILFE